MPESWIYHYVHIRLLCDIDKFIPIIHFGRKLVMLLTFEADNLVFMNLTLERI